MTVDIESLDFGTLCYLVGHGFNERVVARLGAEGYTNVKASFGYVVQHLLGGEKSVSQLAACMGITQQAASKRVREMVDGGLLATVPGADRRELRVTLSPTGHEIVECTRRLRSEVAADMLAHVPTLDMKAARAVLLEAVQRLALADSIQHRRVQELP